MAAVMAARQGRDLQRYSASTGGRIVVGCIPYRVLGEGGEVEVLVISSRKKGASAGVMFPKGGWELDESMEEAARREALEKAGVRGDTSDTPLGRWCYQNRRFDATCEEGYMFPLRVTDELEQWPKMSERGRTWVTVREAMDRCPHWWMREALEKFAGRRELLQQVTTEPKVYTFKELNQITNGFSEERLLGTGGYGRVYKGVLDNGELIAVKKLNSQSQPGLVENSFNNELVSLMRVQHTNIIRLVGYCSEIRDTIVEYQGKSYAAVEQQIALCFECMQGGTLEKLLSDESCGLDWEARYKIIKGICLGLKHLHTGSKNPIYHLDLKPANVLLDKDLIPKIGDFGLSRLLDSVGTFVTKTNSGTRGYMPPEYTYGLQVSPKFDVFSLGIIILQVVAGPEGYYNYKCIYKSPQEFIDHVIGNWQKREQAKPMWTEQLQIRKCIRMALRCVEENRAERPTITEIVEEVNMIS